MPQVSLLWNVQVDFSIPEKVNNMPFSLMAVFFRGSQSRKEKVMEMKIALPWLPTIAESAIRDDANTRRLCIGLLAVCFLVLVLAGGPAFADDQAQEEQEPERGILDRPIGDNWVLSPVIFPIYSPEKKAGLAIGGLATFSTAPQNETLPRSTIVLVAIPSSNNAFGVAANLESFWLDDRLRAGFEIDWDTGPANYWGVGYDAGKDIEEDEDVTEYDRDVFDVPLVAGVRLGRLPMFAGITFNLINMEVNERSATQEADPHYQLYGDEIQNVGAGFRVSYDTRDDTVNAYSGRFFSIEANFYRDWLGSDQEFEQYGVDYRQYHQIKRPGRTLAWQVAAEYSDGDIPWVSMPSVGSSNDLRGYTYGRFRDKTAAWALVEYRHMTDTMLWKLGRNGFALWAGIGFIGEDFGDFGGHELPNAGVGYRLELQDRRNLRLDVGVGYEEVGIYLNFAEAF